MAKILGLPKLSPTMEEGTLVAWLKKEGDSVEVDDLLAEVETDKATMEFRSFDRGVLLKILAPAGATLAPDMPVAILGELGEDIGALLAEASAAAPSVPASASEPPEAAPATVVAEAAAAPSPPVAAAAPTAKAPSDTGRVVASPLVRRLARERGVDLSRVAGSGPHGRVIKRDLERAPSPHAPRGLTGAPLEERVEKISQMRKTIARRLTESKRDVPHYYLTIDVDAAPMLSARAAINADLESQGVKVSVNDLLIKACAAALRRYPRVNVSFTGDTLVHHGRVDISVAVALPDGLITPVIRNADQKSVAEIAQEVRALAARARDKRLQPEEYTDGTFSISNLGMFGIEEFTAVINTPEAAILAVGTVRDEPVVRDGVVMAGKRMRMTMSCDHRAVDGAMGAEFLALLKQILEAPVRMFL